MKGKRTLAKGTLGLTLRFPRSSNVAHEPLDRIWHRAPILDELRTLAKRAMTGPCATCDYAPTHCRGGCRASAFLHSGSLHASDPLCFRDPCRQSACPDPPLTSKPAPPGRQAE